MELGELKGIGSATEERLNKAGIDAIDDLATAKPEDLTGNGISERKANTLISRAKRETVIIQSGAEAGEEAQQKTTITTGMDALDEMIGGGFRSGHIIGIPGASSSGKTQLVFKALGAAVAQTGKNAVYIETERGRFDPQRIADISDLDRATVDERVWRAKAYSLDQQREAYAAIRESFDDVSIIAVDSFTARFRLAEQFEGRTTLSDRNSAFVRHLNEIERTVQALECPALLTLQVMGNPQRFGGDHSTWGGSLVDHTITYTVKMAQAQGSFRKAQLRGHPSQSDDEVLVSIGDDEMDAHQE